MRPLLFEDDQTFWFETQRVLGHIAYGGADLGEAVTTAQAIRPGDYDSWREQWSATAERVEREATDRRQAGHRISARDGYLRAATYFRSAEFFLRDAADDPRGRRLYDRGTGCFRAAAELITPAVEPITVPYQGTTLPAYLMHAAGDDHHRPTLLMCNGFDGWAEEMYHGGGLGAVERGFTVVLFDGPGQPGPRWHDGLAFRPDWENVVGPVLDAVVDRPQVDPHRIALMGNSMGGYLAPRAAAFDARIAAVLAIDGVYDAGWAFTRILGLDLACSDELDTLPADELDRRLRESIERDPQARWAARQGMWSFGTATPLEFLRAVRPYHLRDGVAERVRCPVFIGRAETDQFFAGQPEQLAEHVALPTLADFTNAEGAGAHCQVGAQRLLSARMVDWLTDVLQ